MNSKRKGSANTGLPNGGGPITTSSGLVFIGATRDRPFRAFDAKSGKELLVTWTLLSRNSRDISRQKWQGSTRSWLPGGGPMRAEAFAVVQTAMMAKLPYTALRDAVFAHPTMAKGLGSLFAGVPARTQVKVDSGAAI